MMKRIPLSQGTFALVDDEDFKTLSLYKWHLSCGRPRRNIYFGIINGKPKVGTIIMYRQIMNAQKGVQVDHINGDPLDNRRSNLRLCSRAENNRNARKIGRFSSKYKGVCWVKAKKLWRAEITFNRKAIHLGYFRNEDEAATAYNAKAEELFKNFAYLNKVA